METTPELTAEGVAIVRVLASVLDHLVLANAPIALTDPGQVSKFHAMKAPGIGIHQYLERIHKYASCSNECFILALIYIDRLIQRNNFLLTELNVHRVVITAVLLAAKFFDDSYYNNAYYAKVGGVLTSEINGLEVDYLFRINFSLRVTTDEFGKYRSKLLSHLAATTVGINHQIYNSTSHLHHQSASTPVVHHPEQQQYQQDAAAAASVAFSAQLALLQAIDQQNSVALYTNDIRNGINEGLVQQLAAQITPSPSGNAVQVDHQLLNSILHSSNGLNPSNDILAMASNNLLLQSLGMFQQTLESSALNNTQEVFPLVHRTQSLPLNLNASEATTQYVQGHCNGMDLTNSTFNTHIPQSCPQLILQNNNTYPTYPSYPPNINDQYLRLLLENSMTQPLRSQHSHQHQQQQQHQVAYHTIPIEVQQPDPQCLLNYSMMGTSGAGSSSYNNMIVLQNEARRLAVAQGQILAAAGLSGVGM